MAGRAKLYFTCDVKLLTNDKTRALVETDQAAKQLLRSAIPKFTNLLAPTPPTVYNAVALCLQRESCTPAEGIHSEQTQGKNVPSKNGSNEEEIFQQRPEPHANGAPAPAEADEFNDEERPCGLANFGVTCFVNSAVQILFAMPKLRKRIIEFPEDALRANRKEMPLFLRLRQLFSTMAHTRFKWASTADLLFALNDPFGYTNERQQDAAQLLTELIQTIDTDDVAFVTTYEEICAACTNHFVNHVHTNAESMLILTFPMSHDQDQPLPFERLMSVFNQWDSMEKTVSCETCNAKGGRSRRKVFRAAPDTLYVQLARFAQGNQPSGPFESDEAAAVAASLMDVEQKINTPVNLEQFIEIRVRAGDDTSQTIVRYELVCFIEHWGESVRSGHFVSFRHDLSHRGTWWFMNDHQVTQVTETDALARTQAYILGYQRCDARIPTADPVVNAEVLSMINTDSNRGTVPFASCAYIDAQGREICDAGSDDDDDDEDDDGGNNGNNVWAQRWKIQIATDKFNSYARRADAVLKRLGPCKRAVPTRIEIAEGDSSNLDILGMAGDFERLAAAYSVTITVSDPLHAIVFTARHPNPTGDPVFVLMHRLDDAPSDKRFVAVARNTADELSALEADELPAVWKDIRSSVHDFIQSRKKILGFRPTGYSLVNDNDFEPSTRACVAYPDMFFPWSKHMDKPFFELLLSNPSSSIYAVVGS